MFKFSQVQVVDPNTYASILQKLTNRIIFLFQLMDQESWQQKKDSFTIIKLRLLKMGEDKDREKHKNKA